MQGFAVQLSPMLIAIPLYSSALVTPPTVMPGAGLCRGPSAEYERSEIMHSSLACEHGEAP